MSSVSNMTAVRALISALPRKELQALDKEIRGLIEASPKKTRVAAVGQKAWFAFMRHCRDTMAERFTEGMKAPEMAVVCKAIRQEDEAVYTAFVEKFKAENSAPASDAEASSSEEAAAPAAPLSDAEASSATKPVKRVRLSPEAKAAKEAAEAEEKEAKKAEKARVKAEKEAKEAEDKAQKAMLKAEAKANKDALAAEEKAAKAAARAAKSAEKSAEKEAKKAAKA